LTHLFSRKKWFKNMVYDFLGNALNNQSAAPDRLDFLFLTGIMPLDDLARPSHVPSMTPFLNRFQHSLALPPRSTVLPADPESSPHQ
jgi:hypothetical protein